MKKSILRLSTLLLSFITLNILSNERVQFSFTKENGSPLAFLTFKIEGEGNGTLDDTKDQIMIDDARLTECSSINGHLCNKVQQILQNTAFERTSAATLKDELAKITPYFSQKYTRK